MVRSKLSYTSLKALLLFKTHSQLKTDWNDSKIIISNKYSSSL